MACQALIPHRSGGSCELCALLSALFCSGTFAHLCRGKECVVYYLFRLGQDHAVRRSCYCWRQGLAAHKVVVQTQEAVARGVSIKKRMSSKTSFLFGVVKVLNSTEQLIFYTLYSIYTNDYIDVSSSNDNGVTK